jgi:hypothetical protein
MRSREDIACELLNVAALDRGGFTPCPGAERHTKGKGKRDFRVCLDGAPTGYCFHSSCSAEVEAFNKELRRRIWFNEHGHEPPSGSGYEHGVSAAPRAPEQKRLDFDLEALKRFCRADLRVDHAWLRSRSPIDPDGVSSDLFLGHLYKPGERVLVFTTFKSQGQFIHWIGRGSFRLAPRPGIKAVASKLPTASPDGVWFLCQPITGEWKPNPRSPDEHGRPKMSRRSEEVVTAWRYLVLESDSAPEDLWLNFLAQVPLPIAAIYTSGGRSIHALVKVDAGSKTAWDRIKKMITPLFSKLGADPGALTAVRLTRLPGCMRGNQPQKLLYLNPDPDMHGTSIESQVIAHA